MLLFVCIVCCTPVLTAFVILHHFMCHCRKKKYFAMTSVAILAYRKMWNHSSIKRINVNMTICDVNNKQVAATMLDDALTLIILTSITQASNAHPRSIVFRLSSTFIIVFFDFSLSLRESNWKKWNALPIVEYYWFKSFVVVIFRLLMYYFGLVSRLRPCACVWWCCGLEKPL